ADRPHRAARQPADGAQVDARGHAVARRRPAVAVEVQDDAVADDPDVGGAGAEDAAQLVGRAARIRRPLAAGRLDDGAAGADGPQVAGDAPDPAQLGGAGGDRLADPAAAAV